MCEKDKKSDFLVASAAHYASIGRDWERGEIHVFPADQTPGRPRNQRDTSVGLKLAQRLGGMLRRGNERRSPSFQANGFRPNSSAFFWTQPTPNAAGFGYSASFLEIILFLRVRNGPFARF